MKTDEQQSLFPYVPHVHGSDTSKAAAQAMPDASAASLREHVYRYIKRQGAHGATDHEIQVALQLEGSTQRPRRVELVQQKRITDSGERRETPSGRKAAVWVLA